MSRPFLILAVATGVQTLGATVSQSLGVLGPVLVAELELADAELGLLVSALNIGSLVALTLGAPLVDRAGATRLLGVGSLLSFLSLVAGVGLAWYPVLLVCLGVVGAAWGLTAIAGGEVIFVTAPLRRRATLISIRQLGLPLGGLIAAAVAPLVAILGWQGVLLCQGVAFALIGAYILRSRAMPAHEPRRSAWLQVPSERGAVLGVLSIGLTAAQYAFLVYATLEMTRRMAVPFELAAWLYLVSQAVGAVARVALGLVSDRANLSRAHLLALNSAGAAGCAVAFGLLSPTTPLWMTGCVVVASAAFLIGWNGILIVAIAESGPRADVNRNLGAGLTLMRMGNVFAPPIFGLLLAVIGSMSAWFLVAGMLVLLAVAFVWLGESPFERTALERNGLTA